MRYCDVLADAADVTLNMGGIRHNCVQANLSDNVMRDLGKL